MPVQEGKVDALVIALLEAARRIERERILRYLEAVFDTGVTCRQTMADIRAGKHLEEG